MKGKILSFFILDVNNKSFSKSFPSKYQMLLNVAPAISLALGCKFDVLDDVAPKFVPLYVSRKVALGPSYEMLAFVYPATMLAPLESLMYPDENCSTLVLLPT